MKKFLTVILSVICVTCFSLFFVGCNNNNDDNSTNNNNEYKYENDVELLEVVCLTKEYLEEASVFHNCLLNDDNYKNNKNFTYDDGVEFVKNNYRTVSNVNAIFSKILNNVHKIGYYEYYSGLVLDLASSIEDSKQSLLDVKCDVLVYESNIKSKLEEVKKSLNLLESVVLANSFTDLEMYENAKIDKSQEVELKSFIQKVKVIKQGIVELVSMFDEFTDGLQLLEENITTTNLVLKYISEISDSKEELLAKYDSSFTKEKINNIYNEIDNLIVNFIDYKKENNINEINESIKQLDVNIELLIYIDNI